MAILRSTSTKAILRNTVTQAQEEIAVCTKVGHDPVNQRSEFWIEMLIGGNEREPELVLMLSPDDAEELYEDLRKYIDGLSRMRLPGAQ